MRPASTKQKQERRKHDEYASETCMDSARVNAPPFPSLVTSAAYIRPTSVFFKTRPTLNAFSSKDFFFSLLQELHLDPVIPPGFVVESRVHRETRRFSTYTLKRYQELSRIKFICAVSSDFKRSSEEKETILFNSF